MVWQCEGCRLPIPPQAHREMQVRLSAKTTMPVMRDDGGIGGLVLDTISLQSPP
ncbi:MAG: hypothetical protein HY741_21755 [Chloroflexi bacterium]|nr:hypothetical protein [Chloroflexota bacterium]